MKRRKDRAGNLHLRPRRVRRPPTKSATTSARNVVLSSGWNSQTTANVNRELGFPSLADVRLPVVRMPDGLQLFAPSLRESWPIGSAGSVQPQLKEYELSIYGAGPAGLSAAV